MREKSAQRERTPRAAKSAACSQLPFRKASIKAIPKKMMKTVKLANFISGIV